MVVADAVDVIEDEAHGTSHPLLALTAELAYRLLEGLGEQALLETAG